MTQTTDRLTIDNLGIKTHERYAQDQAYLDTSYIKESSQIPPLAEITTTVSTFSSQMELLFHLERRNSAWAYFSYPPKYRSQPKRFFSHRLLPTIFWDEKEEEHPKGKSFFQKILDILKKRAKKESEAAAIKNLLSTIEHLDSLLLSANTKRKQYQKG